MFKKILSKVIVLSLKLKGIDIDSSAIILKFPALKIRGNPKNIKIGKVLIMGEIDLRIRENGKIEIEDGCKIEKDCRLVSARDGIIKISENSTITIGAIINGGSDVIIGKNCVLGPRAIINANDHKFEGKELIRNQGFIHKKVVIEDDCWFGANVVVNKGVIIKKGSVVGACSLVTKDTEEYSINFGVPSKKIKSRI